MQDTVINVNEAIQKVIDTCADFYCPTTIIAALRELLNQGKHVAYHVDGYYTIECADPYSAIIRFFTCMDGEGELSTTAQYAHVMQVAGVLQGWAAMKYHQGETEHLSQVNKIARRLLTDISEETVYRLSSNV